jgi:hypothetical protein
MAIALRNEKSSHEANQGFETLTVIYCVHTRGAQALEYDSESLQFAEFSGHANLDVCAVHDQDYRPYRKILLSYFVLPFLAPDNPIKE